MCGIIGYVGKSSAEDILIDGLKRLSYRGYDSAGISVLRDGIHTRKKAGKTEKLIEELKAYPLPSSNIGIAHTRWATHGNVNDANSHPHSTECVAAVHNGIIENYMTVKKMLLSYGYQFKSETDTEVAVCLIDCFYKRLKSPTLAIKEATSRLHGSYALVIMFRDEPETLFATKNESPLLIGVGDGEILVASDLQAFVGHSRSYLRLDNNELAVIKGNSYEIYDKSGNIVNKALQYPAYDVSSVDKSGYEYFMRKEISEEKDVVKKLISLYTKDKTNVDFNLDTEWLSGVTHITVVGCGTAYHAGLYFKRLFEEILTIRTEAVIASEFRYSKPLFDKSELVIFISQSGETADTLSALRMVKKMNVRSIGIVNVKDSSIAAECDDVIYTHAGAEIAVASTKAYIAQCVVGALLTLYFAQLRGSDTNKTAGLIAGIKKLADYIEEAYGEESAIIKAAKLIMDATSLFFIGRGGDYIAALEGSLKLKEISYIHSESYPAGELKHGTISLVTEKTPVVALLGQEKLKEKTLSNLKEVAARGAPIIAISSSDAEAEDVAMHIIKFTCDSPELFPIPLATVLQLLAYHTSILRGCDVDQPRNLAKSVTVE